MIVLYASLPVKPNKIDEARDIADDLVEKSNQETKVIDYRATVDIQDRNTLRFIEQYEDAEAFDSHRQTDHIQEFEEKLPALLAGEPNTVQFKVSEAIELGS